MNPDCPESSSSENRAISPAPSVDSDQKGLFEDYVSSGHLPDFIIVSSCGCEFNTHRTVLSLNSAYFDAMFKNENTKEAMENRVNLNDIDATTIGKVIDWAYKATSHTLNLNVKDITMEVVFFVDRFLFHTIKQEICEVLTTNLTVDVVCERAVIAAFLSSAAVLDEIVTYFAENKMEIRETESYQTMCREQPQLTISLLEKCIHKDQKLLKDDRERASFWQERYLKSLNMASGQLFAQQQVIAQNLPEAQDQPQARVHQIVIDDEYERALQNGEGQLPIQAPQNALDPQNIHVLQNAQAQPPFQAQQIALDEQNAQLQPPNQVHVFVPNPQHEIRLRFAFHVQSAQNVLSEMTRQENGAMIGYLHNQRADPERAAVDERDDGAVDVANADEV